MAFIYHLVQPKAWEKALDLGVYRPESLKTEGFIHFSTREQVLQSATRFFTEDRELVVVEVHEKRLKPHLRYEEGEPGQSFPHYYQSLPLSLVENTHIISRNREGEWEWG